MRIFIAAASFLALTTGCGNRPVEAPCPAPAPERPAAPVAQEVQAVHDSKSAPLPPLGVDDAALEVLKKSLNHLSALKFFSVKTQTTFEDELPSGQRVDYETHGSVVLARPNKLWTKRQGNDFDHVFFYNGKELTVFSPAEQVYSSEAVPDTIEGVLQFAHDELGIGSPISDLVHHDAYPLIGAGVNGAAIVGHEVIDGTHCVHALFSRPDVEFQIWVPTEGAPLPVKYTVTDTDTSRRLSITTTMSQWDVTKSPKDKLFTFSPPAGVKKVPLERASSSLSENTTDSEVSP